MKSSRWQPREYEYDQLIGHDVLKQVRKHLLETARPLMEKLVREVTRIKVVSMHQDISTVTGEEVVLFTLAETQLTRETKRR